MTEKLKSGELVIAEVKEVHSNSVELELVEYNLKGFLNVSNIPGLWIRDLKKNIKKGQLIVGRVVKIDHAIELSLKKVSRHEKEERLREYSREKKAVKMFKRVCSEYKIKTKLVEEEVSKLKDQFGGLYEALKKLRKDEEVGLKEEFSEVGERFKTGIKVYEFKGELELHSNLGNGLELIKDSLKELTGIEITYIGNTKFLLKLKTKDPRKGEKNLNKEADKAISKIKSSGGVGEFKIMEK